MVAPVRGALSESTRKLRLERYLADKRGWGGEAARWLAGEVPTYWLMKGLTIGRKVVLAKYTYALLWTDDVVAERWLEGKAGGAERTRDSEEYTQLARCAMCGKDAVVPGQ